MGKCICICGRYSKSVIKLLLFFSNMNEFESFVSIFIYNSRAYQYLDFSVRGYIARKSSFILVLSYFSFTSCLEASKHSRKAKNKVIYREVTPLIGEN